MTDHELTFAAVLRQAMADPGHLNGFEERLAVRLDRIDAAREEGAVPSTAARRRTVRRRRWAAVAVGVAAIALGFAVLAATVGTPTRTSIVPTLPPAKASEVVARAERAFSSVTSLRAMLVVSRRHGHRPAAASLSPTLGAPLAGPPGFTQARYALLVSADGSYRQELVADSVDPAARHIDAFDATSGTSYLLQQSDGMAGASLDVVTSMSRGLPGGFTDTMWYSAVAPALEASGQGDVATGVYDGRPCWILTTAVTPGPTVRVEDGTLTADQTDQLQVTVDGETGFPVRVCAFEKGSLMTEYRLDGLTTNVTIPDGSFIVDAPVGARVSTSDWGFEKVTLDQVPDIVGYAPLVARREPPGFRQAQVDATAAWYVNDEPTPRRRRMYEITYRRGFDAITIGMWQADQPAAVDPIGGNLNPADAWNGSKTGPEKVRLRHGALAGEIASVSIAPFRIPHLWLQKDGLRILVIGTVSRDELLQVAESLAASRAAK